MMERKWRNGGRRLASTAAGVTDRGRPEPQRAESVIQLFAMGPTRMYAEWKISWPRMRMVAGYLQADGGNIRQGIRLYDVTGRSFDGANAHSHRDIWVPDSASTWHIDGVCPGRTYVADFGLFHHNRFCPILRSNPATTPINPYQEGLLEEAVLVADPAASPEPPMP